MKNERWNEMGSKFAHLTSLHPATAKKRILMLPAFISPLLKNATFNVISAIER